MEQTDYEKNLSTEQHQAETYARFLSQNGIPGRTQRSQTSKGKRAKKTHGDRTTEAASNLGQPMLPTGRGEFPKTARLRKRLEFVTLTRSGEKARTPNFVVITRDSDRCEARLGVTVSSKVGNAVVRNRVKRLIRECFRRCRHEIIPHRDVLIIARKGAADLSFPEVTREIRGCLLRGRSCSR